MSHKKPLFQKRVDEIRYRVWLHFMRHVIENKLPFVGMRHLWFPEPHLNIYELRVGNPPADCDRPWWLKGLRLEVDCTDIPSWLHDVLQPGGTMDDMIASEIRDRQELAAEEFSPNERHQIRIELFDRLAKRFAAKGLRA